MLSEWIGRLLGRRKPARPAAPRRPAGGGADQHVLDLRHLAEYDLHELGPLPLRDGARVEGLQVLTMERFRQHARSGLPFPEMARRLIQRGGGKKDVNSLVQLVQQEPVLSAQLLRTANSAAHAELGEARGIREAVMRLGPETAWQIALTAALLAVAEQDVRSLEGHLRDSWHDQWSHAMVVAATAGWFAVSQGRGDVERLFLAGLLHDIGKIFAIYALNDLARDEALGGILTPPLLETVLEGIHVELGRELTAHWNLPAYIGAVCASHHDERLPASAFEAHLVRVISGIDELRRSPWHRGGLASQVSESAAVLELDPMRLREILAQLRHEGVRTAN